MSNVNTLYDTVTHKEYDDDDDDDDVMMTQGH